MYNNFGDGQIMFSMCFQEDVEKTANNVWDFLEPLLFASIGTEIDLFSIKPSLLISATILLTITCLVSDQKH